MTKNWHKYRFKNVVHFNPQVKLHKGEDYYFVPMEDVESGKLILESNTFKTFTGNSSSKFINGDILFARITPCLQNRKITQIKLRNNGKGFGSTEFFIFRADEEFIDQNFLNYYVRTNSFVESAINSMVGASGRQRADKGYIENLEITVPDIDIQRNIAKTLSNYDKLIENNTKRISILEQMAEQLYKEWFVRMRFPNYENTKFTKGIPEGWKLVGIGHLSKIKSGFAFKSSNLGKTGIPIIKIRNIDPYTIDIDNCEKFNGTVNKRIQSFKLKKGDLIIAMTGAQIGKIGLMPEVDETYFLNQRAGKFFLKEEFRNILPFLFHIAKSNSFQNFILNYSMGAAQPNISGNQIENFKLLLPEKEILNKFLEYTKPQFEQIFNLIKQNRELIKTRDLLLPRLISGKLTVN